MEKVGNLTQELYTKLSNSQTKIQVLTSNSIFTDI